MNGVFMRTPLTVLSVIFLTACSALPSSQSTSAAPFQKAAPTSTPMTQSSPSPTPQATHSTDYPDLGKAPEIAGDVWINSAPLRLADLKGKVVLMDMWTFECINCIHTVPSLLKWYETYSGKGLVIIGNHFPEFDYERDLGHLKQAVVDLKIPYPVVQDNDGVNWRAFNNQYWPTFYLIDKQGRIRYLHIGEGAYADTEKAIQALLDEPAQ
jgi:thiol-disulfide isomerase/thioredoxin